MMITKVRRLGLGLFPAAKDVSAEENGAESDDFGSQRFGRNGLEHGSNPSLRPSQVLELSYAESNVGSDRSTTMSRGPGLVEGKCKPNNKRISRKSYGLELFEAALRESARRQEKEWADIDCQTLEKDPEAQLKTRSERYTPTSFEPEFIEYESKSGLKTISQTASYRPVSSEAEARKEVPRRGKERENRGSRTTSSDIGPGDEHFVEGDAEELCVKPDERFFLDEDRIKLVQKNRGFRTVQRAVHAQYYVIIIPKRIMTQMPNPPNSYVSPPSVPHFYIRVLMVHMSNPTSVDAAVNWLMDDAEIDTNCIVGLKCELGPGRELNLIQLSLHRRCVLIRLVEPSVAPDSYSSNSVFFSPRLAKLLATHEVVKSGTEIQDDVVAIYWATGMVVNSFKNVAEVYVEKQRALSMLSIFRKLYKWEWTKRPDISTSDWGQSELSSKQIKYGIMSSWSSRMIALEGAAAVEGAATLMSLENIPRQVLDLFGRAIADALGTEESAAHETSGTLSETSFPGTLQLLQNSFRSRVKGRCVVEMHLKEDQGSAQYKVTSRKGKAVMLTPCQRTGNTAGSGGSSEHAARVAIESIKSLTIIEGAKRQVNWRSKRLWEGLRSIILDPPACPQHLLMALGCNVHKPRDAVANEPGSRKLQFSTTAFDLRCEPFITISRHLNDSQREAWQNILTNPLSATIGPPGTGKTSLIQSVAKSWIARRGDQTSKQVLLCTAYQNVAVRHLAETLVEGEVPGVLLLISEDYYFGWHESFYTQLVESVVVSSSDPGEFSMNLAAWRSRNDGRAYPNVVVCTVDQIGNPSFVASLMNGKVTTLVIDESSQASDVSFLRPLVCLPDLAMVSVLGDPHQLPPYSAVRNDVIVPSVFDLVSNSCRVNFLREQYRMPPSICKFLSAEIYNNVLMTAPHRLKEKDIRPLVWSHVRGVAAIAPGKTSLYNVAESVAIVRFCTSLVRTMKVACERVVVLTLYEEQTRRIADGLAANELEIPVHNVDSFQGQQCDIVLISLVVGRCFSSFAADQRRACVMLSRVRRLLCVFGDFDEVKRNTQAGLWSKLANHCNKQNLVIDEDKVECFLASSVEEAKDMWVPRQDKNPHRELLSNAATAAAETEKPPAGIAVQVVFKARC